MRLNPFSKKNSGGYYARIKAEFEQVERELAKTRKAHAQAQLAQSAGELLDRLHIAADFRRHRALLVGSRCHLGIHRIDTPNAGFDPLQHLLQ